MSKRAEKTSIHFKPITNRTKGADGATVYELPADGFVQIVPAGTAPNVLNGRRILQVVDARSIQEMFNRAIAAGGEVLVDDEHFSHDADKGTDANAWQAFSAETLQVRADGLYGMPAFTPRGLHNVTSGEKRFISPEFSPLPDDLEQVNHGVFRPLRVTGFGLTNRPAFKSQSKPLANRDEPDNNTDPDTDMHKTLLAQALGIKETEVDSLDESALKNRISALLEKAERADKAESDLAAMRNREADEFMTAHDAVIPKDEPLRKVLRETVLANRAVADAMVAGFKSSKEKEDPAAARAGRKPLFNRDAQAPENDAAAKTDALHNRRIEYRDKHKVTYEAACAAVRE